MNKSAVENVDCRRQFRHQFISHCCKKRINFSFTVFPLINYPQKPTSFLRRTTEVAPRHNTGYSGSQSHTTRRGRASCSLWYAPVASNKYAPVANVCDLLLFLDENRVIPEFRHFWKVTSPDEELFTVLYFLSDAFPMTWPRKLFNVLNSTGMMVTWLRTLANTRP